MPITIEQLREDPSIFLLLERIQKEMREEANKRQHFYETIQETDKVEFINGEIIFQSPAKNKHFTAVLNLAKLLDTYVVIHNLGKIASEKCLISLTRNDYEPDICFFSNEKAQHFTPDQMQFPAPDLVVEVLSPSTKNYDYGIKMRDYAAHQIPEYWIIYPDQEHIEQYLLTANDTYELHIKAETGIVKSTTIKGFELPIRAIFDQQENLNFLKTLII
ncbi:MAG: Uma2 family endonuclease [Chitinophagales bacterium]|nr:Uma2 family endonuclease [Chitinophagales bacterium]